MPTTNERLADEAIAHQEALQRYSNGVVRRIIALLNRADGEIAAALANAMGRLSSTQFNVDRLDALLTAVRALNESIYREARNDISAQMRQLVDVEVGHQFELFSDAIPAQVRVALTINPLNAEQAYSAALARPFQGRLLREWMASLEATRGARIRDTVRQGYVQNETVQQIVTRIRGTRARKYADGLLEIDRRSAEAVARTAVSHFAGFTRDRMIEANADIIAGVVWTATLDTRTSEICRVRDGKRYTADEKHRPVGHSLPWLGGPGLAHWNCRSTAVPVLKGWQGLGLVGLSAETRASMDGQVPAEQTFGAWLKRQSAQRQDDVLGPTRAALFRKGGVALDRFYNDKGRYLSIEELRARSPASFRRAGLH